MRKYTRDFLIAISRASYAFKEWLEKDLIYRLDKLVDALDVDKNE